MNDYHRFLINIYDLLLKHFGPRGWWPGDSNLEIIIGAILTQAVAWKNVEKAINNIKKAGLLDFDCLSAVEEDTLAELIKPALYHRQKAKKIKNMINFIANKYQGNIDIMLEENTGVLREKLLAVWGIGPETADSILLYAGNKKIFVVDAYTRRIFSRLGIVDENISYAQMQDFMHSHLPREVNLYNEYHALIVALGAGFCKKKKPLCRECPIVGSCKYPNNLQEN